MHSSPHSRACGSWWGQQQGWGPSVCGDRERVAVFLQCQLNGLWRNDQDSLMEISVLKDNGDFEGQYLTRVTLSGGCAQISPLKGAQKQLGEEGWPTFAFTVHWEKFSSKCWDTWGWHGSVNGSHTCSQQGFSFARNSAG